jgi:type IV pilus assembly protein PilA
MSAVATEHRTAKGFSWSKLIAVLMIVGLLAGIAIPLYLDQVKKAHDAKVKSDLNTVANAIVAAVSEDQTEPPVLAVSGRTVTLDGNTIATLSAGMVLGTLHWVNADQWCIDATDPAGKHAEDPGYKYKVADKKTETGQCS